MNEIILVFEYYEFLEAFRYIYNYFSFYRFTHRLSFASRLLRKIHFREIPSWKLDNLLQKVFIDQSIEKQSIYKIVIRETYRQIRIPNKIRETAFTKSHSNHLVNSRGMELAIVKVGGFSIGGITNEITYCLSKGKWRHLTSIPHVEQCNFGTAVLDNELYVVGGSFNQSLQENIHPFGFRYSPRYNKWTTIAPMQRERCRFSLNVLSGRLYAIGGSSELEEFVDGCTDQEEISACECYDPASDSWSSISPLPEGRSQHASVTWCNNANEKYIFISGGLERDLTSDAVRRYDPATDTWDVRAPMLSSRADHVMISLGHRIYVCGGWFEDADIGSRVLVDTIDAYDLTTDSWEVITRVPTPRYHAGIVEVDGKIYFIGGFHSDAMFDRDTAAIECYDVENDFWTTEEKYPQDVWEHTCVTLYIPKCRDDMEVMTTNENRR